MKMRAVQAATEAQVALQVVRAVMEAQAAVQAVQVAQAATEVQAVQAAHQVVRAATEVQAAVPVVRTQVHVAVLHQVAAAHAVVAVL